MPKTPKIDVITVRLTVHIPLDRASSGAVLDAYKRAEGLLDFCSNVGESSMEKRLNRVPAPKPADDGLDIPEPLRRTAEPAAAE